MSMVENKPELTRQETTPTFIPLFRYSQVELLKSREFYDSMNKFALDQKKSFEYWENKIAEGKRLRERMEEQLGQSSMQVVSSMSFITCDMAYLKFLEDFETKGLSKQEIFDFFKLCLYNNSQTSQVYILSEAETERASIRDRSPDFLQTQVAPLFQKAVNHIPPWFKGSPAEYVFLMNKYSSFGTLLQPEIYTLSNDARLKWEKQRARDILEGKKPADSWAATIPKAIPDWVDDDNPPDKEAIEKELINDLAEYELSIQERASKIRAINYLDSSFKDKHQKNRDRLQVRWDLIRMENPKLGDFLSFLALKPEGDSDSKIRYYIDLPDRTLDPEAQSLWIEENMKKTGIIQDGNLTTEGKKILNLMFFNLRGLSSQEERQKLFFLRGRNKKAHDTLRFILQPIINFLDDEDILLLNDFLSEGGTEAGAFISFFADILVSRLESYKTGEDPNLDQSLKEFREFLGKFLRNNWRELFQKFNDVLFTDSVETEKPEIELIGLAQEDAEAAIYEEEIKAFTTGNLSDWKVIYSCDQTTYPSSLAEVSGKSLDEKSGALGKLLLRLGVSNSIKVTSIVNAIDWKTQGPEEIEQMVPAIIIKCEK